MFHLDTASTLLRDETRRLAAFFELPLDLDPESEQVYETADSQGTGPTTWQRYGRESYSCLRLYHAASHSITTGAALVFT
jgi:hypothetical protein